MPDQPNSADHPGLLALCAIAGPIAAAHPTRRAVDVAEDAERIARACMARCVPPAVTETVGHAPAAEPVDSERLHNAILEALDRARLTGNELFDATALRRATLDVLGGDPAPGAP